MSEGIYTHKLKTPFEYEGKVYETIDLDFEKLTGNDVLAIEKEMSHKSEYAIDPLFSRSFQCKMVSRASGVGSDVIEALPLADFTKIVNAARDFLAQSSAS